MLNYFLDAFDGFFICVGLLAVIGLFILLVKTIGMYLILVIFAIPFFRWVGKISRSIY